MIDKDLAETKYRKLQSNLKELGSILVAFSGGVDSSFLTCVSRRVLGDNMLAVTAASPVYPENEVSFAQKLAQDEGIPHLIIQTEEMSNPDFVSNPVNRCYHCKGELFRDLQDIARKRNLKWVADGSNCDDLDDHRPGRIAAKELGVISPLVDAGLSKEEIRHISLGMGLKTWNKPSLACLASRVPYGTKITEDLVHRIYESEKMLREMGFSQVRVRHHNNIARIEILPEEMTKLFEEHHTREVVNKIRKLGYTYVTLDLLGYRTGSMNE